MVWTVLDLMAPAARPPSAVPPVVVGLVAITLAAGYSPMADRAQRHRRVPELLRTTLTRAPTR
jgi:hypothetical protein